jgi:hypothetical protein
MKAVTEEPEKLEEIPEAKKFEDLPHNSEKKKKKKREEKERQREEQSQSSGKNRGESDVNDQPQSTEKQKKREEKEREVEEVQSLNEGRERAEREEEGILEPFKKREKGDDGLKKDRSHKSDGNKAYLKVERNGDEFAESSQLGRTDENLGSLAESIVHSVEKSIERKWQPSKTSRKRRIEKIYFSGDFIESALRLAEPFDPRNWPRNEEMSMEKKFPRIEPFHPNSTLQIFVDFCQRFVQRPLPKLNAENPLVSMPHLEKLQRLKLSFTGTDSLRSILCFKQSYIGSHLI